VDADAVLEALHDSVRSTGNWTRAHCPFCLLTKGTPDRNRSLGVHDSGHYHCFRCETKGYLGRKLDPNFDLLSELKAQEKKVTFDPPEGYIPIYKEPGLSSLTTLAPRKYLISRGIGEKIWKYAKIGVTFQGYFRRRIIVPVRDEHDLWVGFVSRIWDKSGRRKYNYPKGMKRDVFYDDKLLYEDTDKPLLIVEGVFDALPYAGVAMACFGKPTKNHIEKLKLAKRPIVMCLDGDAWKESYMISQRLRFHGVNASFLRLPPGEDPNTVPKHWLLNEAFKLAKAG
jgi:hypothetical protein